MTVVVTIGITGHRVLSDLDKLHVGLDAVVRELDAAFPGPWTVVSILAEGTDRLVTHRLLDREGTSLVAVLPLPAGDYEADFATATSAAEFRDLLARAHEVVEVPPHPDRDSAYEVAAHAVLALSDVMVAVWDGHEAQGRGGTGATVAEARERGLPLAWVHAGNRSPGTDHPTSLGAEQGQVTLERFPRVTSGRAERPGEVRATEAEVRAVLEGKFPRAKPEAVDLLVERGAVRGHQVEEVLCQQDELEHQYAVIVSGQVDVYKNEESRRRFVAYRRAGASLGGLEYLTGTARVADAVAAEPVVVLEVSFDDLEDVIRVDPEVLRVIARETVGDLLESQSMFMELLGASEAAVAEQEVFISYARPDLKFAKKLAGGLRRFGVATWVDVYSIRAGASWARQVGEALDRCAVMVLVMSPSSMASENSDDEWNYFLDKKRPVVPVLLEHTDIPYRLNKLQYVDFTTRPFDSALTRVVIAIRNAAASPPTQQATTDEVAAEPGAAAAALPVGDPVGDAMGDAVGDRTD